MYSVLTDLEAWLLLELKPELVVDGQSVKASLSYSSVKRVFDRKYPTILQVSNTDDLKAVFSWLSRSLIPGNQPHSLHKLCRSSVRPLT